MNRQHSEQLFLQAKTLFPGGVNSPVRAFKSVGGTPIFMKRGKGSRVWDEDDNEYIDFCCSWGPLILGHAPDAVLDATAAAMRNGTSFGTPTRAENLLGELILKNHRFLEKIRFVSSGTEAVMSGLRLARGYTGRSKILKFDGCYHGHVDALLVNAGSGLATLGTSSSAGVTEAVASETIVVPLNDREALSRAFEQWGADIACVIIEPIPANNGLLLQERDFLVFLREICTQYGALLFFDEVISGFRVGFEGAAGLLDIRPDIVSYGKIIGGGFPVGAYGASAEIMSRVAPDGPVYQAGTLSGNPVAMTAGYAQLSECLKSDFYESLDRKTEMLVSTVMAHATAKGYAFHMARCGSIFWIKFSDRTPIRKASDINPAGMTNFARLHALLLERGVYLGPSGYEVGFVSAAHTEEDLTRAARAMTEALDEVFQAS
jgi:glutamate-1-semialdehyde 2,1-aminomutase